MRANNVCVLTITEYLGEDLAPAVKLIKAPHTPTHTPGGLSCCPFKGSGSVIV